MTYLLDTCLISELVAKRPNQKVVDWLDNQTPEMLYLSVITMGEIAKGIELLEQAAEREPALAEISEHLGDAYWKAGRKIDARYAWRNALVQSDGADATRLTGKIDFGLPAKP